MHAAHSRVCMSCAEETRRTPTVHTPPKEHLKYLNESREALIIQLRTAKQRLETEKQRLETENQRLEVEKARLEDENKQIKNELGEQRRVFDAWLDKIMMHVKQAKPTGE
jgi:predicted nuclease with TOPRIM domain